MSRSRVPHPFGDALMAAEFDSSEGSSKSSVGAGLDQTEPRETGRTSPYRLKALSRPPSSRLRSATTRPTLLQQRPGVRASHWSAFPGLKIQLHPAQRPNRLLLLCLSTSIARRPRSPGKRATCRRPNIIVANPGNGHAHIIYMLADPVHAWRNPDPSRCAIWPTSSAA